MDILKSAKYHYEALAQEREIRVLVLELGRADDYLKCHLKHVSLDDPLPYEALSYFWGDPNKKDQIHCGNGTLLVTINLHSALRHFAPRRPSESYGLMLFVRSSFTVRVGLY